MDLLNHWLLTTLIFLPTLGAIAVLFAPSRNALRWTALATTLASFALSLLLLIGFHWGTPGVQMIQRANWIEAFHIEYLVGLDGLSFPLVMLSTIIFVLACVASWNIEKASKGYFALFLLLETGILGTFLSLDLFLFYVFFEVTLLPMYFLIGIWGGSRKEYAAIKFFLYTLVGSIGLLIAMIGIYLYSGTFDLIQLASPEFQATLAQKLAVAPHAASAFFLLLMFGFFVKIPAVPFHTWLPDAHVEAPTPISMLLAALLLKMGGYGIFRVAYPLFPDAAKQWWLLIAIIGVVSIIYGAFCAMGQTDFKKLVAYSSVSHMGFVTLGAAMMTQASVSGAMFMMIAHGITSAAMFFVVGIVYDRTHHRNLTRLGGFASTMPIYTGLANVAFFASLGLPGLCGFVGEIMVLLGSFSAARSDSLLRVAGVASVHQIYTLAIIACFGLVLTAAYMLWTIQRVYLGPIRPEYQDLPEINARELTVLTPLAALAVLLGILPSVFVFTFTNQSVALMFKSFWAAAR